MESIAVFVLGFVSVFASLISFQHGSVKSLATFSDISMILPGLDFEPIAQQDIYLPDHSWVASLSASKKVVLLATGDVMTGRVVNQKSVAANNFIWPYEKTVQLLSTPDISLINLETPIIDDCPVTNTGMVFCADRDSIEGLLYGGIDVASIANNHIGNHDQKGVEMTKRILAENNILVAGGNAPVFKTVNNLKFAFLGYNDIGFTPDGISGTDREKMTSDIRSARSQADVVIVEMHWGNEYQAVPSEHQKEIGHFLIDAGADIIIGNHPHWIQPIEVYNGKIIVYSHGNFVFDQMWSEKTREGIVTRYTFYDKKLIDVEVIPVKIDDYGQPRILEGDEKKKILNDIQAVGF